MKTENIILAFLGIFGLLFFFMWWQRQNALMMAGTQQQGNFWRYGTQQQRSQNETVGGVVNTLANTGTLSTIANVFGSIFGGGGNGGGGGGYYDEDYLNNYLDEYGGGA